MIEYTVKVHDNGTIEWYLNEKYHREDGPAVEYANGDKEWWLNGKLHREDGPAVERTGGNKSWHFNGKYVSKEEHASLTNPVIEMTVAEIAAKLGHKVKVVEG